MPREVVESPCLEVFEDVAVSAVVRLTGGVQSQVRLGDLSTLINSVSFVKF